MKKQFLSAFLLLLAMQGFSKIIIIGNWGTHFTPADTTIKLGDTINFVMGNTHNALEVSKGTYEADTLEALPGGFNVPMGGGMVLPAKLGVGTHYYICTPHISLGMKGTITVVGTTAIETLQAPSLFSIFPNPASDILTITSPVTFRGSPFSIMDGTGKQVLSGKLEDETTHLTISGLATGIYFFQSGKERKQSFTILKK